MKSTNTSISRSLKPITFNRDEYFLDATDRKNLISIVKLMVELGCTQVFLMGTHDDKSGGLNNQIAILRANAVKNFLRDIAGPLSFKPVLEKLSQSREVQISCAN